MKPQISRDVYSLLMPKSHFVVILKAFEERDRYSITHRKRCLKSIDQVECFQVITTLISLHINNLTEEMKKRGGQTGS